MMSLVLFAVVFTALLAGLFAGLLWRLSSTRVLSLATPEWLADFSTTRYRALERLLGEADFEYLRRQPGYRPEMERRLRAERRRVFRRYLRSLTADFARLHNTAKLLLLHSAQDRPELAREILKQRATFVLALAMVHGRLTLHALGLTGIRVPVDELVGALEAVRQGLGQLAAPPAAAMVPVSR
jgi:hypothetical protein